jgi:hypothetical protein
MRDAEIDEIWKTTHEMKDGWMPVSIGSSPHTYTKWWLWWLHIFLLKACCRGDVKDGGKGLN